MKLQLFKAIITFLFLFSFSFLLHAEEAAQPIKITSDTLVSDNKTQTIAFIGNVKAIRDDMTMNADQMDILQGNEDEGKGGIDRIVATGNVTITNETKTATADKAVYYEETSKVILTGNPRSWEGKNVITGEEMIFFINEDRLVVKQGEKEQVSVVFYPEKDNAPSK